MCARSPRSLPDVTWPDWEASIRALSDSGNITGALLTIERALPHLQDSAQGQTLLRLLDALAADGAPAGDVLRLRLRLLSNQPGGALGLERAAVVAQAQGATDAFIWVYLAWALNQRDAAGEALHAAEHALRESGLLRPHEHTLAWRMKGLALHRLRPDSAWEAAFQTALEGAEDWGRGLLLIDLGGLHSRRGNESAAMLAFAEALPLTRTARYRAWTLNNMGLICLRQAQLAEAEDYFRQLLAVRTQAYRSRALSGQAAVQRARGEWVRAYALYDQAAQVARTAEPPDEDDLRQALRGLGHTQRLAGQRLTALDTLHQASRATAADRESGRSWVNVDVAAVQVADAMLDAAQVEAHLTRTGPLDREDHDRALIVRAELARRVGRPADARRTLEGLSRSTLWVREEAHAFPLLFGLLPEDLRPEPLPRPRQTTVSLRVLGLPEVQVNGRPLRLSALEVVMLTALVDAGGELTTDELSWVLRDERPRALRVAAQRVSRTATRLRAALGWPASVQSLRGHYRLDPEAHWTSDLQTAQREHRAVEVFLAGIGLPWATEREQELRQAD